MLLEQKMGTIGRVVVAPEVKLGESHRLQLPQPGDGRLARFSSTTKSQVRRDKPMSDVEDRKFA